MPVDLRRAKLIGAGWKVEFKPWPDLPHWQWTSPRDKTGPEYRCKENEDIPEGVVQDATEHGELP